MILKVAVQPMKLPVPMQRASELEGHDASWPGCVRLRPHAPAVVPLLGESETTVR
jgi:hypothetical protein